MATPPTDKQLRKILMSETKLPDDIGLIICALADPMLIFTLKISGPCSVTIPTIESVGGFSIDWGDGQTQYISQNGTISHQYAAPGRYIAGISGHITYVSFSLMTSLVDISQWGCLRLTRGTNMFMACDNLRITAEDILDVSRVTNMENMFKGCTYINFDASMWDVSKVTDMESMFSGCASFNGDLSRWDVSKVTNMAGMFAGCVSFNSDLSRWDVSSVTAMCYMFRECQNFNCDLSLWDVSRVTNMTRMFHGCRLFNCDLSDWPVLSVLDVYGMLAHCDSFEADLSNWQVSDDGGGLENLYRPYSHY